MTAVGTGAATHPLARRMAPPIVFAALALSLIGAFWWGVSSGPVWVPLGETLAVLAGGPQAAQVPAHGVIVSQIRLPRVLAALLIGWGLAVSGMVMQGLFQNPLASPYVLGIASGASAGAAAVIAFGLQGALGGAALGAGAFAGGALVVSVVYRLARWRGGLDGGHTLVLAGVALGALFSAVTTFLIFLSGEQMREIVFWIMGNLGRAHGSSLPGLAVVMGGGTLVLWGFMRELNALSLGEGAVRHLGLKPEKLQRILLLVVTVMTATAVAVAGTIGFVGLIVPHAMRLLLGPDQRLLLPASALAGALFLLVSDTLARTALAPLELPVGVLTAFTGAPFFLFLLVTWGRGRA